LLFFVKVIKKKIKKYKKDYTLLYFTIVNKPSDKGGKRENKIKIIFFYYIFNYDKITAVPVSMVPILTLYTLGGSSKGTRQRE